MDVGTGVRTPVGLSKLSVKSGLGDTLGSVVLICVLVFVLVLNPVLEIELEVELEVELALVLGIVFVLSGIDSDGREKDRLIGSDNDNKRFWLPSIAKSSLIIACAVSSLTRDWWFALDFGMA